MRLCITKSVKSKFLNKETPLVTIVNIMRTSKFLEDLCKKYRNYVAKGKESVAKDLKKGHIPAFFPVAYVLDGKKPENVIGLTAYGIIDIDHITEDEISCAMNKLKEDCHTVLAYKSISGHGIHIMFRYSVDGMKFSQHFNRHPKKLATFYKQTLESIFPYYKGLLHLKIDRQVMNVQNQLLISYDPELIFNPSAEPFPINNMISS